MAERHPQLADGPVEIDPVVRERFEQPLIVRHVVAEPALVDDDRSRDILVKNIEYKPMDVEEAVMQMDLIKNNFLVFTNARTEAVNVLYRQKDGNYGLIQPRT